MRQDTKINKKKTENYVFIIYKKKNEEVIQNKTCYITINCNLGKKEQCVEILQNRK